MQKKLSIVWICLALVVQCMAQQDSSGLVYNLQQCVELALKNNVDVKTSEFNKEGNKVNWQQARGNMLPFVSGNVNHSMNQGRSIDPYTNAYITQNYTAATYGLNASVTLWNASSVQNAIKQYHLLYSASEMDYQQTKDNTTINVILAYLDVLNNQEQLNMAIKQAEVTRTQVERLQILDKDGAVSPSDLYNMKGQLGTNELSVVNMRNSLRTAQLTLTQLMNIPFTEKLTLQPIDVSASTALYDGSVEQIYQQAVHNLAMVKAADLREESSQKAIKAAQGQLYPTLSLGGNVGTNYSSVATKRGQSLGKTDELTSDYAVDGSGNKLPVYTEQESFASNKIGYGDQWRNNVSSSVSLGLQIPILNGLSAKSRVRQAKINEKQAYFNAQTIRIQLRQQVEQAYVNMSSAFDRFRSYTQQVADYGESFRAAQVKFDAGAITSVDYNIAKNNVDQANLGLIAAKYDYILRTKVLDYYQGRPLF